MQFFVQAIVSFVTLLKQLFETIATLDGVLGKNSEPETKSTETEPSGILSRFFDFGEGSDAKELGRIQDWSTQEKLRFVRLVRAKVDSEGYLPLARWIALVEGKRWDGRPSVESNTPKD